MTTDSVGAVIEAVLVDSELEYEQVAPNTFAVSLPGEARLRTACLLTIGEHALSIEAFVMRHPDERQDEIHAWLLRHNARMYGVAWTIDDSGDIYLTGKVALAA